MTNLPSDQRSLTQALIESAAERAKTILSAPDSGIAMRQLGPDGLSDVERLEHSPLAEDQFLAVGLRLAVSRAQRGDITAILSGKFATPASALEIEADRRTIWQIGRIEQAPVELAEQATTALIKSIKLGQGDATGALPRWAAFYADLWCDPRIGAVPQARRIMLAMVSSLHERSLAASCR